MNKKISYSPLDAELKKISELVNKERYRNADTFIDKAIQILLTWESENPEKCMDIMKTMTPFTKEQERFMNQTMKPEEKEKHFEKDDYLSQLVRELETQSKYSPSSSDHINLRENLKISKNFITKLKIKEPETLITYDGYFLLLRFYSRILPVKIVLVTLGDLLRENNKSKIKLKTLHLKAYDIAEEISAVLQKYEKDNNKKRNEKLSTGLPKIENGDDIEKRARIQKRFKEQYIGKLRKNRQTNNKHFEGALIALGLIYVEKNKDDLYVSLTEEGKEFYLMDNPVINGNYNQAFSKTEQEFIYKKLLSKLKLEYQFIQTALKTIEKYDQEKAKKKITEVLDEEFFKTLKQYSIKNQKESKIHELDNIPDEMNDRWKKYIIGQRVATMGRMAELSLVKWVIDEAGGDSIFTVLKDSN